MKSRSYFVAGAFAAAAIVLIGAAKAAALPAFPGAEGFGANATGGRGGSIHRVTNLDDSGPGSLRDAAGKGPRIIVFDVGGTIQLKSPLKIASDVTVAGQTAPGDGVGTLGAEVSFSDSHNVIVRYMRFRQGLAAKEDKKSAVAIANGHDIILDHVSIEWGRWDNVDMNKSTNITIQNSIIGEGIAPQRFGCLCQSDGVTFTHDLFINNHSRNPKAKGHIQFVNNVVYNWELEAFIEGGNSRGKSWDDVIGNYFIKGPSTKNHPAFGGGNANAQVYAAGNFLADKCDGKLDGHELSTDALGPVTLQPKPFAEPVVEIDSAQKAYEKIVAGVGCSLHRDAVDRRLIADLTSLGTAGKIIRDPAEVGGIELGAATTRPAFPAGARFTGPADSNAIGPDGYSAVETWINSLCINKE
jgi:pectate lyase